MALSISERTADSVRKHGISSEGRKLHNPLLRSPKPSSPSRPQNRERSTRSGFGENTQGVKAKMTTAYLLFGFFESCEDMFDKAVPIRVPTPGTSAQNATVKAVGGRVWEEWDFKTRPREKNEL